VLDGLLHPHSSIPYVQMGHSIALCTVSLLSRDSCERAFIRQLILPYNNELINFKYTESSWSSFLESPSSSQIFGILSLPTISNVFRHGCTRMLVYAFL